MTASRPAAGLSDGALRVEAVGRARALVARLGEAHEVISWAVVNGGRRRAAHVVWREVLLAELGPDVDARALMERALAELGLPAAVGLLTARDVRRYEEATVERGGVRAWCVAMAPLIALPSLRRDERTPFTDAVLELAR